MKLERTARFKRDFVSLPEEIQRRIEKQLAFSPSESSTSFTANQAGGGYPGYLEGRVTKSYGFTFQIKGYTCILRRVGRHDILETP
jgi:hypothetical protein